LPDEQVIRALNTGLKNPGVKNRDYFFSTADADVRGFAPV